jgi:hypothetical protein
VVVTKQPSPTTTSRSKPASPLSERRPSSG